MACSFFVQVGGSKANDQPYKKSISVEEALTEIKDCAGEQFEPELVVEFISYLEESYFSSNTK